MKMKKLLLGLLIAGSTSIAMAQVGDVPLANDNNLSSAKDNALKLYKDTKTVLLGMFSGQNKTIDFKNFYVYNSGHKSLKDNLSNADSAKFTLQIMGSDSGIAYDVYTNYLDTKVYPIRTTVLIGQNFAAGIAVLETDVNSSISKGLTAIREDFPEYASSYLQLFKIEKTMEAMGPLPNFDYIMSKTKNPKDNDSCERFGYNPISGRIIDAGSVHCSVFVSTPVFPVN